MQPGDFLGPHNDNVQGRRLAFVFCLSSILEGRLWRHATYHLRRNDEYLKSLVMI